MSDFPLIKKLGLKTTSRYDLNGDPYAQLVTASDLEQSLASAPVVYGSPARDGMFIGNETIWSSHQTDADMGSDTHSARLLLIEPLSPATCDHLITVHLGTENSGTWYECRKCDKKLRATFEVIT